MLTARKFETIRVQVVAFSPKQDLQPTKVVAFLLDQFLNKYDGELQSIALPQDVPAEIPRAVLQSSDRQHRFEIGPARLSSQWQLSEGEEGDVASVVRECVAVLKSCVEKFTPEIERLAVVISRSCPCEFPSQTLIQRFCTEAAQNEPFNHSANFEIHNHKQYVLPEFAPKLTINSWVRCKTARVTTTQKPAILVEQDINTRVEDTESRTFNADELNKYFKVATREADSILAKYFPG